jgi:hypothetical protein
MKKALQLLMVTSFLVIVSVINANAQNCYDEYYKLFTDRGASVVPDGPQEVVITVRDKDMSDCYMGRVQVKNNQIIAVDGLQLEDGSYKKMGMKLSPKYTDPKNPAVLFTEIIEGMSTTLLLDDGKLVNIFFIKQLSSKMKSFKHAPPASSL